MKIQFNIFLLLVGLMLLVGCSESEVPPEPDSVGGVGNFYVALGDWVTEADTLELENAESMECTSPSTVTFGYKVSGDEFVYNQMYIWNEGQNSWDSHDLTGTAVPRTKFLSGTSKLSISMSCDDAISLTGTDNGVYAVAYSCSKDNGVWDCRDNKWQLEVFNMTRAAPVVVELVPKNLNIDLPTGYAYTFVNESAGDCDGNCELMKYVVSDANDDSITFEIMKYTSKSKAKTAYDELVTSAFDGLNSNAVASFSGFKAKGQSGEKEYLSLADTSSTVITTSWRKESRVISMMHDQLLFEVLANEYPSKEVFVEVPDVPVEPTIA